MDLDRPPMHQFWTIHELVEDAFGYLGRGDLYRCSRLCKATSNIALDRLYRYVEYVTALLKILGPIGLMEKDEHWNVGATCFNPCATSLTRVYRNSAAASRRASGSILDYMPDEFGPWLSIGDPKNAHISRIRRSLP